MTLRKLSIVLAWSMLAGSGAASAGSVDVIEYSTGYFAPYLASPGTTYIMTDYYRWWDQDWGWQHAAMDTTGLTSATLDISAWDVDSLEIDVIKLWDNQSNAWVGIGNLVGSHLGWHDTSFILDASWYDEIATGLKVRIDIDSTNSADVYAVTLSKSVLSLTQVPLPASAWLFASGLLGLMAFSRGAKART